MGTPSHLLNSRALVHWFVMSQLAPSSPPSEDKRWEGQLEQARTHSPRGWGERGSQRDEVWYWQVLPGKAGPLSSEGLYANPASAGLIFIQLPFEAEKRSGFIAFSSHVSAMFYCFNCTYERHSECSLAFLTAPDI